MTEFCGIPLDVKDNDQVILKAPGELATYPVDRTCDCDPATLVRLVLAPTPGVMCECGGIWPIRFDEAVAE